MNNEEIKLILGEILRRMAVSFDEIVLEGEPPSEWMKFHVRSADSNLLIGKSGANLMALNYLLKRIVAKKTFEEGAGKFFVDVNGYQSKQIEELRTKAKILGERARSFKADVELEPMSAYERMFIHSCLEGSPDLKTESKGEGKNRRVVIKYVETSL